LIQADDYFDFIWKLLRKQKNNYKNKIMVGRKEGVYHD